MTNMTASLAAAIKTTCPDAKEMHERFNRLQALYTKEQAESYLWEEIDKRCPWFNQN
jgi:hypothetical protein